MEKVTSITMSHHHAVLLVNLGSPKSTSIKDVRSYLREFLMDPYVIDTPWLLRAAIVYGTILPKRPAKTAAAYKKVWTPNGSPLVEISKSQQSLLQNKVEVPVALGMRYSSPSINSAIQSLVRQYPLLKTIHVIPLYPHYAMSTITTAEELIKKVAKDAKHSLKLTFQKPFYNDIHYLNAMAEIIQSKLKDDHHLIFSYHGLPERHLKKTDPTKRHCLSNDCCKRPSKAWDTCYKYQTITTTRKIASLLDIPPERYTISYQSQLGNSPWIQPNTVQVTQSLAKSGVKKLAVVSPSFVTDCLETLEEINIELRDTFLNNGGKSFTYIPCLNTHKSWINTLKQWVEDLPTHY